MALSMSAADATPCSSMRIASSPRITPRRLDANPGESFTRIGSLPSTRASAVARSTWGAPVRPCVTISTSVIRCTGLKKCIPRSRQGSLSAADPSHGKGGGVRGEQGPVGRFALDLREDPLLDRHLLDHRFDHHVGVAHGGGERRLEMQALVNAGAVIFGELVSLQPAG